MSKTLRITVQIYIGGYSSVLLLMTERFTAHAENVFQRQVDEDSSTQKAIIGVAFTCCRQVCVRK